MIPTPQRSRLKNDLSRTTAVASHRNVISIASTRIDWQSVGTLVGRAVPDLLKIIGILRGNCIIPIQPLSQIDIGASL